MLCHLLLSYNPRLIQAQLDLYHASENLENGEAAQETIQMVTEQNERLSHFLYLQSSEQLLSSFVLPIP